ncbi:YicC/YloC family endoribonuclease [Neisseria sp. Ec49-e6-T10]|uniref:YicC/YloC family endoribonuclease n=1 Tax=Neisseria sp. Ec49-e6-T10 TaxID=3140744 RepID=UPI003EB8BE7A
MIQSMTGFSNRNQELKNIRINLELRAVNHRYLDIQIKQPEELRHLEQPIRELIQNKVQRGKVECRINIQPITDSNLQLGLNEALLNSLLQLNQNILKKDQTIIALSVADILKFPQILNQAEIDPELLQENILSTLNETLNDFCASRQREGEKLKQHLTERLDHMLQITQQVETFMPQLLDAHYDKLQKRLHEALDNIQDDRIKQEFVLFMQKADVDEELSRLKTHINEVKRVLKQGGTVGKRLDFLMQELNREANTLGSKAIASESTQASVELKVLIEQMREQVQNIE